MEQNWERTIPFFNIDFKCVCKLFEGVLDGDDIDNVIPIDEGCRTTNYIVKSKYNKKKYILKIFNDNDQIYKKEIKILELLSKRIPVQRIYKFADDKIIDNNCYGIYEYIEGNTISKEFDSKNKMSKEVVISAANVLAEIHSTKFNKIGFLNEKLVVCSRLEPLYSWYGDFINENVKKRLDNKIIEDIKNIVFSNKDILIKLDQDSRLVHGDFQGTNILIEHNIINGVLDWEFSMAGHPLSDIGQFFRYDEYFTDEMLDIFESVYSKKSDYVLFDGWYKISKLRDLVNLIQLLGREEEMPNKYTEILKIIKKTLSLFQK